MLAKTITHLQNSRRNLHCHFTHCAVGLLCVRSSFILVDNTFMMMMMMSGSTSQLYDFLNYAA